jgi:hypothetical protein
MYRLLLLSFIALPAFGQSPIDYSNCVGNVENGYIDNTGTLNILPPFKQTGKKVVNGVETVFISCTPGSVMPKGGCYNYSIELKRDANGNLIGHSEGKLTATKEELEYYAKTDLELLKQVFYVAPLGNADVNPLWFKDTAGNSKVLNFDTISTQDYSSLGLDKEISFDDFHKFRQMPSFSKDIRPKMDRAFQTLLSNKKRLLVEHGKETNFVIVSGVCYKKEITARVTNIRVGISESAEIFNLKKCAQIIDAHNKHLDALMMSEKSINSSAKELSNAGLTLGQFRYNVPSYERSLAGQAGFCKKYQGTNKADQKGTHQNSGGGSSSNSTNE